VQLFDGLEDRVTQSDSFDVTRGVRQGGLLSPLFFNIFLNDLLVDLENSAEGLRIGGHKFSSFAYADDVTLLSATVPGLQSLINMCTDYAATWRLKFGIKKSNCMVMGRPLLHAEPRWLLGAQSMQTLQTLDILGVTFSSSGSSEAQVEGRITKCRKSFHALACAGMAYPGAAADVKSYMWRTACLRTLVYGPDWMPYQLPQLKYAVSSLLRGVS
jgi:hypothetical protein